MLNKKGRKGKKNDTLDNSLQAELKSMKLGHSNDLTDFLAEIVKIKEAMTNNPKSGFRCRYPKCYSNCTVTKSNCSHCFVCVSLGQRKYACPQL